MNSSLQQLLRLSLRARKIVSGDAAVKSAVKDKKVCLILLAEDASRRTRERFKKLADFQHIPVVAHGSKYELGEILQKPPRSVAAILDQNFARGVLRALERGESHIMSGPKSRR